MKPENFDPIQRIRKSSRTLVRELGLLAGEHAATGVSYAAGHAMLELAARGPLTVGELAALLRLDKSTTSRICADLRSKGWSEVVDDDADARRRLSRLTPPGKAKVKEIDRVASTQVSQALGFLEEPETQAVIRGLELYAEALARSRMAQEILIRTIRAADNRPLAKLIRTVVKEFGHGGRGGPAEDAELGNLRAAYGRPRHAYFVAERDRMLLGGAGIAPLAGAPPDTCELRKMYLSPNARGLGIGRTLLERCFETAKAYGYSRCYIETTREMTGARRLYEAAGCTRLSRRLGSTGHFQSDVHYLKEL
ncbi:MAG: MarR family transcriptional regulator [Candidatus Wallbacteria bacterium]|nr:MarR family transcriptional regulator [Candidatus Wallbacteria bacterium]